jgi:DtxR family Mn-dependent transcriptional regulator
MPNERQTAGRNLHAVANPHRIAEGSVLSASGAHASAGVVTDLSETLEDYLEIIYALSLEHPAVRVRDIARAKGVRMPTVTAALRRLSERALVSYQAREHVGLTDAGKKIAHRLTGRHRFLTRFLAQVLGVVPETAERDACGLEHHLSACSLERLAAFVEYIDTCPSVDPAFLRRFHECFGRPDGEGVNCPDRVCLQDRPCRQQPSPDERGWTSVLDMGIGEVGRIVRVKATEKTRSRLVRLGLLPGTRLEKLSGQRGRGVAIVILQGHEVRLTAKEAAAVWVSVAQERAEAHHA